MIMIKTDQTITNAVDHLLVAHLMSSCAVNNRVPCVVIAFLLIIYLLRKASVSVDHLLMSPFINIII